MHIEHSDFQDQLVRGLTHKMNNILSLFHGYLGLILENQTLDPALQEGLCRIKEGARAASELMDRTKALARPSSVVWRQVAVGDFLRSLKPTFNSMCTHGVTVEIDASEKLPPLWTDTARLRIAIVELVRNACEASDPGRIVTIHIRSDAQAAGPNGNVPPVQWLSIGVTNRGKEIPEELQAKIFQPFFTTKLVHNATGLGLTVAVGLVEQLGGVIRFASANGTTTFRILLPSRVEGF
jgi:signal transduction histidine kinase